MEIRLYNSTPAGVADPLRGDIHLSPREFERLSGILQTAADRIPADFVLLTDRTGQMIASVGSMPENNLTALASLMAADFAANEEIGRLFGCKDKNARVMLRECDSGLVLMLPAGSRLALLLHTANSVASGWARIIALDAVKRITEKPDFTAPAMNSCSKDVDTDFSSEVDQAFDDLWSD